MGPRGDTYARLALDTGATASLINISKLVYLGYDPAAISSRMQITTGSGAVSVPLLTIDRIEALGKHRAHLPVLGHTLPLSSPVDGLLGLDFLRGRRLTLDFRRGQITLT